MNPRIDSHQHFWQYSPDTHGWITDETDALKRDFLPSDLQPLLAENEIAGCVAVQASQTEQETTFLLSLAGQYDFIKGVVGWVDLQDYNVKHHLARWADHPKLVGIRHQVQDEPDEQFLLRPAFLRSVKALQAFDLTYDLLITERQLPAALSFVAYLPDVKIVLDHLAKPHIAQHELLPWQENIRSLAQYPNVYCKLSGLVTEADWQQWSYDDLMPYLDVAVDAFGTDRLMFGSDWPVCTLSSTYAEVASVINRYFDSFSEEEHAKVFGTNAIDFYQLTL